MGLLICVREMDSILLTTEINVSSAKLLMSGMPTLLLLVFFLYVVLNILLNPDRPVARSLTAGSLLGLAMLVRTQSIIMLLIPFGMLLVIKKYRVWRQVTAWVTLGMVLVISPWIWRNWQVTG